MKRILLAAGLLAFLFSSAPATAQSDFSAADLKRMGTFLSNFTELGFMDFEAGEITNSDAPGDMIRFGVWHNYVNNYSSRITSCRIKNCEWGALTIDGRHVRESVKKYFDHDIEQMPSITDSDPPYHYDGQLYHFAGADGEAVYYARVDTAERDDSGRIIMRGEIYNAEDKTDRPGKFEALAKAHNYQGKATWAILSMKTEYYE